MDREWGVWKGIIHSGLRGLLARGKWGSKECIIVRKFNAAHIKYNYQKKYKIEIYRQLRQAIKTGNFLRGTYLINTFGLYITFFERYLNST